MYVATVGSQPGYGTSEAPYDLDTANTNALDGDTLILKDGVYTVSSTVTLGKTNMALTYQADTDARPVFTHGDGAPPAIVQKDNTQVIGLWFGGTKPADQTGRDYTIGNNCVFEDSVLFNYAAGISDLSHTNRYTRSKFIRNGFDTLWHALYINGSENAVKNTVVEECIFIACLAYSIHPFHVPENVTLKYNFVGRCQWATVFDGTANEFFGNIWWSVYGTEAIQFGVSLNIRAGNSYHDNFHGPLPIASGFTENWFGSMSGGDFNQLSVHSGNYYYSGDVTADAGATLIAPGDDATLLGDSAEDIDAAVAALETSFSASVATIQADSTIETNFATLKAVIDTWKAQ